MMLGLGHVAPAIASIGSAPGHDHGLEDARAERVRTWLRKLVA